MAQATSIAVACGAIGVGLCTMWVFPALAYVSAAAYGIPAAVFILLGYGVWRFLALREPTLAGPFLIGFSAPIAMVLATMVSSVPLVVLGMVAPVALMELLRKSPWVGKVG